MCEVQRSIVSQHLVDLRREAEQERLGKLSPARVLPEAPVTAALRGARGRIGGAFIALGVLIAGRSPSKARRPVSRSV